MEMSHGVKGNIFEDIFFTEESIAEANVIKNLSVEISRQNSNLNEIKKELAKQAKNIGATAIMNFKYGQRKHKTLELVFSFKWDTESWYGEGQAIE